MTDGLLPGNIRPLPFPLKEVEELETETPDDGSDPSGVFVWPEDSDERVAVTFEMSLNEFVILASAIDIGSDIGFGEKSTYVWWLWTRRLLAMPFCAQVINCITTDADTQAAMRDQLLSDPDFLREMQEKISIGTKMGPGEITQPIGQQCDRDALWAGCVGLVQQMNRNNDDFLEQVEVLTDPIERVTTITRLIPQLKVVEAVFDFVNELVSNIQENYDAEYTTDYENDLACELFCLALANEDNDCFMSFEDIYNIFKNRLVASFTIESAFDDAIQFLATGTWSGTQVCDFMFMFQMQCINSASKFLAIDLLSLQQMFQVGESQPNTGWTTLCLDCPETCIEFNISGSDGGWVSPVGAFVYSQHFNTHGWSTSHGGLTITDPVTEPIFWVQPGTMPSGTISVKLTFSASVPAITIKSSYASGGTVLGTSSSSGSVQTIHGIDATDGISVYLGSGYPDGVYLQEVCYE